MARTQVFSHPSGISHAWTVSYAFFFLGLLLCGLSPVKATPLPFDLGPFIHDDILPTKGGGTIQDELHCYSLPYGGIGFASHVLTYWTVIFLGLGRKPLPPFSKLKHNRWDLFLSLVTIAITVPLAAFTIVRCRQRWQFVLLAVWKTTMSFTLAIIGLHRSISLRKHKGMDIEEAGGIFAWLLVYGFGTIVGLTGLLSLVAQTFHDNSKVRIICYVFGGIVGAVLLGLSLFACFGEEDRLFLSTVGSLAIALMCAGVLAAFYSDWILGAIANNNWAGMPSGDNIWLYWSYFVAKRLPLLSL